MSFVAYVRSVDPAAFELLVAPGLFLAVFAAALVAGLRWRAALCVVAMVLAAWIFGVVAPAGALTPETSIGAAVAAMLIVAFWKLRPGRT
jgi:hypothetical protein